jgi:hypothetical protein
LGQTYCDTTATTDSLGYFNPIASRWLVRNALASPNTTTALFENGVEGCINSSGTYTTSTCGFTLPLHWYWWMFTPPSGGYGVMDYRPSTTSNTQANGKFSFYVPTNVQSSFAATTVGGGANSSTTLTSGAGSTASSLACATGHACNAVHGTVTFTTGSSINATQPLFTIQSAVAGTTLTRTYDPDCTGYITDNSGHQGILTFNTTATSQAVFSGFTLSSLTAYTAVYTCMGN